MKGQRDIFGGTQAFDAPDLPRYMRRDASAGTQAQLFVPQMEGQLALSGEAPEDAPPLDAVATTRPLRGE